MSGKPDFVPEEHDWLEKLAWFQHETPKGYDDDQNVYRTFVGFPNDEGMLVVAWIDGKNVKQLVTTVEGQVQNLGVHGKSKEIKEITLDDTSMYSVFKANMATIRDVMEEDSYE